MEYYQKHLATREEYLGKRETAYTNVYKAEIKSDSGSSARGLNKNLSTTPIFRRFAAIFLQQPVPPPVPRTIGDKNSWLGQIVWKSIEIYSHTKKKKYTEDKLRQVIAAYAESLICFLSQAAPLFTQTYANRRLFPWNSATIYALLWPIQKAKPRSHRMFLRGFSLAQRQQVFVPQTNASICHCHALVKITYNVVNFLHFVLWSHSYCLRAERKWKPRGNGNNSYGVSDRIIRSRSRWIGKVLAKVCHQRLSCWNERYINKIWNSFL